MSKTFALTSPPMGGPKHPSDAEHIEAFQRSLTKKGYYKGKVDGVYGKDTASSVFNYKTAIGYLHPDHNAGDTLYSYLTGSAKPTVAMKALAAERKHHVTHVVEPLRQKALDWYIKNTGMKESPANTNICAVSKWYGVIGPWCAETGVMAYAQSGSHVFTLSNAHAHNWAYVPNIYNHAREGLYGLTVTHTPLPGHGICYDWPGESPGTPDHFGVFEKWINQKAGTFYAREGNTAVGNDSDGGEIMQRERNMSEVMGKAFIVIGG